MRRYAIVLGIAAILGMAGCTSSSPSAPAAPLATPSGSGGPASPRPATCPSKISTDRYSVPGSDQSLVPGDPSLIVACSYGQVGSDQPPVRSVVGSKRTGSLARLLDSLTPIPKGQVFSCPIETTLGISLYFNYNDGDVQIVQAATSGCLFASNGRFSVQETRTTIRTLQRATKAP